MNNASGYNKRIITSHPTSSLRDTQDTEVNHDESNPQLSKPPSPQTPRYDNHPCVSPIHLPTTDESLEKEKEIESQDCQPITYCPFGPFSPRTYRLLTSPIKFQSLNTNEIEYPDFENHTCNKNGLSYDNINTTPSSISSTICNSAHLLENIISPTLTENDSDEESSIPDMNLVFAKFNINVGSPDPAPVEGDSSYIDTQGESLTISQRIKSLTRESRCRPSYLNSY